MTEQGSGLSGAAPAPFEEFLNLTTPEGSRRSAKNLIAKGWRQGKYPLVDLAGPYPWALEFQEQRSWNFHLHCLGPVDVLLRAYSHWQEVEFLVPALRMSLDWCRMNSDASCQSVSPFAWYDMSVGLRAYRFAYLLEVAAIEGLLAEPERALLWSSLEQHARYLAKDSNIAFHSNHGYYQVAGQLAMGRRFAHASSLMRKASEQGLTRFRKMLAQQFTGEGVHREHSPDYHRMVYSTLKELLDSGLVDDDEVREQARRIEAALAWFVFPDQRLVNFGDSDGRSVACSDAEAAQRWVTPDMRFWATAGREGSLPDDEVAYFADSGYWLVRKRPAEAADFSAASYLALNAAFHSRTHKHADDLSFVWFERGCNLLVDAGRYGYIGKTKKNSDLWLDGFWYSDPWRIYCESTRAHNTLEFDGRNYARRVTEPYGSALQRHGQTDEGVFFVEAGCEQFSSVRQERMLFFKPGQWLVVVDWFADSANKTHDVKQWFHLGPELAARIETDQMIASLPGNNGSLYCTSLIDGPQLSRLFVGEEDPLRQGWISDRERSVRAAPAFCFTHTGASSSMFATLFSLHGGLQTNRRRLKTAGRTGKLELVWQDETGTHQLRLVRPVAKSLFRMFRSSEFCVDYHFVQKSSGPS